MAIKFWQPLLLAPLAVALVVGAFILARRHRSRRATGLAVVALGGLAGDWLWRSILIFGPEHWFQIPPGSVVTVTLGMATAREVLRAGCVLLLICAVVADRWPKPESGPETDYRDPPG